jgi:hypothetical protein
VASVNGSSGIAKENDHFQLSADHSPIDLPATEDPAGNTTPPASHGWFSHKKATTARDARAKWAILILFTVDLLIVEGRRDNADVIDENEVLN